MLKMNKSKQSGTYVIAFDAPALFTCFSVESLFAWKALC